MDTLAAPPVATRRLVLPLTGLSCAGCVRRAERAAAAVPGVSAAAVNLATGTATIDAAPTLAIPALLAAMAAAGYPVDAATVDLPVSGMHCAGCVSRVERALRAVPGVLDATVNLATERARVQATAAATPADLAQALAAAGYGAAPDPAAPATATRPPLLTEGRLAALACLLAAPLLLPMALTPFGHRAMAAATLPPLLQLALATLVQLVFGARFYRGALRARAADMDTLVALGTTAAFALSLWSLLAGRGHLYFEASAAIIALVRLGKWLEARARRGAGNAIRALGRLRPTHATVLHDGIETERPLAALRSGDRLRVRPGARIPADGTVLDGIGTVDESLLTGESRPVDKQPGSPVTGGSLNGDAPLLIRATALGAESQLDRIVRLVEDAQAAKPAIQHLVDRVSAVFVPAVVGLALLTGLAWGLAGAPAETAIVNAVAVLVIACPCALGLATPAAIMVGTGAAARHGILIRDPAALAHAAGLRTVVLDKTGTLTEGRPALLAVHPTPGLSAADALALAAALQSGSEHPLAGATLAACPTHPGATALRAIPGAGIAGTVAGRALVLGTRRMLNGTDPAPLLALAAAAERDGQTTAFLAEANGGLLLALLTYADTLRPGAPDAVARLRRRGLAVHLLTGDNPGAAAAVAAQLGITEVRSAATPADKAARIAALRAAGPVAMVGDGVNDAAALAAADLGIAMASGTDAAAAAAHITLMRPDPTLIPAAIDIAARTQNRIKAGLLWAFAYNLVGLPLAAAGLLNPVLAGAAMAISSTAVVANALLLRRWHP